MTDANLVLGYLDPARFAGGSLPLDHDAADRAIAGLAAALDLAPQDLAWGIHDVATEAMAGAARTHLAERGHDAAQFTLVCTGGGGPVHGYHLARKLGVRRIVVPPEAGVASALGMLAAPPRVDRVATIGRRLEECSAADLEAAFGALEADAAAVLAGCGWAAGLPPAERLVDARCAGQGAHMPVPLPPTPWPREDAAVRELIAATFRAAYLDRYRRPPPAVPIELVHARIVLRGARGTTSLRAAVGTSAFAAPESRSIVIAGRRHDAAVFARAALPVGFGARGPALVQEAGSTLVVGPEGCFRVLDSGNILVEIG